MTMISGTEVATRTLSTAQAENDAVITGAVEALEMQYMMTHLELSAQFRVWTDSKALPRRLRQEEAYQIGESGMRRVPGEQH